MSAQKEAADYRGALWGGKAAPQPLNRLGGVRPIGELRAPSPALSSRSPIFANYASERSFSLCVDEGDMRRANAQLQSDRRDEILAAAQRCFVRAGFHGASMQDICAEAGMSPGNLYRYFP